MRLVYTATGKPVEIGDRHTVQGFEVVVAHAPQPHKPDSEGKITFDMPDGTSGPTYYCGVIGAKWIERDDRPLDGADAMRMAFAALPSAYNVAGHVCPRTGRLAMTVADAYAREDSPDRNFFRYDIEAEAMGLECWRLIDGIDATVETLNNGRPMSYTLDFADGRSQDDTAPEAIVYMQRTKAERA